MHPLCALALLVFSQTEHDLVTRDSVIQNILTGNDSAAIRLSEPSLIISPESLETKAYIDPILLGYLIYAYDFIAALTRPPQLDYWGKKEEKNLMAEWDRLWKQYPGNLEIVKIYCYVSAGADDEKAMELVDTIKARDEQDAFPEYMHGLLHDYKGDRTQALPLYQQAYMKDTSLPMTVQGLAHVHFLMGHYDSAIAYDERLLDIIHKKKNVFVRYQSIYNGLEDALSLKIIICHLKNNDLDRAREYLAGRDSIIEKYFDMDISDNLQKYIDARKRNSLTKADSFFIPNASTQTVYVLTADSIGVEPLHLFFKPPVPIKKVSPAYPAEARKKGHEGVAFIKILVDDKGKPVKTVIGLSSGYAELDQVALQSTKKYRFQPATLFGHPIKIWVAVPCAFKLANPNDWFKK